ncbi:hypothetical protein GF362_03660 [Candidatus Dojkabacteria bacterium]|nr:hypothetical protein [Candidatus Dojkabacteria bacterium]
MKLEFKKTALFLILILFVLIFFNHKVYAQSGEDLISRTRAKIIKVEQVPCEHDSEKMCDKYTLEISEGGREGTEVEAFSDPFVLSTLNHDVGDEVFLEVMRTYEGESYSIVGVVRENAILMLLILFVLITIAIARLQGLGSIVGLLISVLVLFLITIPMILKGWNPIVAGYIGAGLVLISSVYLSHGFNPKTTTALISTFIGLIITSILALFFIELTELTGFGQDEAFFLMTDIKEDINTKGILFVSIIIGGIGLIDDVTVNQISAMQQIFTANPGISRKDLFKKAMFMGRDHIASMVNTLFIAYAGASMPLIMILRARNVSFGDIINEEVFAEEIVRTVVGSIGLILIVPITSYIASVLITREGASSKWALDERK